PHARALVRPSLTAEIARAAGDVRVDDHVLANGETSGGAGLDHPAGVLVSQDDSDCGRMPRRHRQDVKIGATNAGAADLDQHVIRAPEPRLGRLAHLPATVT